jgi:hypothetical protein
MPGFGQTVFDSFEAIGLVRLVPFERTYQAEIDFLGRAQVMVDSSMENTVAVTLRAFHFFFTSFLFLFQQFGRDKDG